MLNTFDNLIIFVGIIGIALLGVGIKVVGKMLKMHKKSYPDEELLTEKDSGIVRKYLNYILIGFIFITIFYGLQLLRLILKVD